MDWDKNPKKKMFTFSYNPTFIENNIKNNIDTDIKNIRDDEDVFKKAESGNPSDSVLKEIRELEKFTTYLLIVLTICLL